MLEIEAAASSKPPQITEMFQKFAIAFKAKTFEFFAEDESNSAAATDTEDGFFLLDSTEDFITDQKVIIIKPDPTKDTTTATLSSIIQPFNTQFGEYLISSLFATISSFEASYLQLQTAHVPFDEEGIKINDRALISQLQKLSDLRQLYINSRRNPDFNVDFSIGSCLEAQVQENQNKLRALETMFNRLQSDIDAKDDKVLVLRKKLDEIQQSNSKLSMKISKNLNSSSPIPNGFLLTIRVFDSMLREACRSSHRFTKLLIELMKKAGWELDLAADYVHPNVEYAKKGHKRYALLSYVCLGMFQSFDCESFGLLGNEKSICNGDALSKRNNNSLTQLFEHVSVNPVETLNRNPSCPFSKFCETKYEELVHPTMESSIFRNLDRNEAVLDSWRSLSVFYEAFVNMSSSIWLLHKLAYSFNPAVEIFRVERGVDFSMVYMEDVTRRGTLQCKSRPKVGFTVVPGFKVGTTIIQSQVYLTGSKCTA